MKTLRNFSLLATLWSTAEYVSVSAQTPFYFSGISLELQGCASPVTDLQTFTYQGDNTIRHVSSNLCVTYFTGNDYGSPGILFLDTCVGNRPAQMWTIDGTNNLIYSNITAITGCQAFTAAGPSPGNPVVPTGCATGDNNQNFIAFTDPFINQIQGQSNLCLSVAQPATGYILNDSPTDIGIGFDGIGIVAGAGSARLLYDYPDPQRSLILNALFDPNVGLNPATLKIEIGGDGMGTMGSEPSSQHSSSESAVANRGTQIWLAQQAKAINPNIKIYALPWSFPGWLRSSSSDPYPFTGNPQPAANYIRDWIIAVQTTAGVKIDYIGIWSDVWDDVLSVAYVKTLKQTLTTAGLTSIKLVCSDINGWNCASLALTDPDLFNAVDIFGAHDLPGTNQDPNITGKTLWRNWMNTGGTGTTITAPKVAYNINNNYIAANMTSTFSFASVGSSYATLPEWNYGVILADSPWSGFYKYTPNFFALIHTTQFTKVGWSHLNVGSGSGDLTFGGNYVTRVDASGTWAWSTVIVKGGSNPASLASEYATFSLGPNLAGATTSVNVFTSCFGSTGTNVSFLQGPNQIPVNNGNFSVWLLSNCIYTLTNGNGEYVQPVYPQMLVPTAFPLTGNDDFMSGTPNGPGKYWADMNGAFEIVDDPQAGRGLQQKANAPYAPATRRMTDTVPHTIMGDPTWEDIDFSIQVYLTSQSDIAGVGVRCNAFNDTEGIDGSTGVDAMPGVWFFFSTLGYKISYNLKPSIQPARSGTFAQPITANSWHTVRMIARNTSVIGLIDGYIVFRQDVPFGSTAPPRGFLGLASGGWEQHPIFGQYSYTVTENACSDLPIVESEPIELSCAANSPGQQWNFSGSPGVPGMFALTANPSLCLHMNGTADPDYLYQNTKAILLRTCDTNDLNQYFLIETTAQDGLAQIGPIQGINGLTMNVFGNSLQDDKKISGYPFQGGSNGIFYFDNATGTINVPFFGTCLSVCTGM